MSYFYEEPCQKDHWGISFQEKEGDLAKELQRLKIQNEKKKREIDAILTSDKEIQAVKRKI